MFILYVATNWISPRGRAIVPQMRYVLLVESNSVMTMPRGDAARRQDVYLRWREDWIRNGMKWASMGADPPPEWNPQKQLRNVKSRRTNVRQ